MQQLPVDFIINLGDFCLPKEQNKAFLCLWNKDFGTITYHTLGNHDIAFTLKKDENPF